MTKRMLIDATHPEETRVVVTDGSQLTDYDFVSSSKQQIKGNIYLAKITRVEPSLQAAFVEYGGGKQGFLPFAEIHPDYYQIPVQDRLKIMQEELEAPDDDEDDDATSSHQEPSDSDFSYTGDTLEGSGLPNTTHGFDVVDVAGHDQDEVVQELPPALPPAIHIEGAERSNEQESREVVQPLIAEPFIVASEILPHHDGGDVPLLDITADGAVVQESVADGAELSPEERLPQAEEVETMAEDESITRRRKKPRYIKRYKIQEVIKRGQIVLVQVIKEERGNKGVSLTTYISLAGRYCVLMPNSPKDGGISRKIAGSEDRKRLKQLSAELRVADGMSAIIRTAGIDRTESEIKRDHEYLVSLWNNIREQTISSTAPALIYEEGNLVKRAIRDLYHSDIEEIWVQGEVAFHDAKEFMKTIVPSHAPRVKLYHDNVPLFYAYDVEDQLTSMHESVVRLRSGGYIVMNPTEALISIDVNSGRATTERNIEETATKTNLEAAAEIARQLRIRDLAGLIVIDFIDMLDSRNRRSIERALKDALKSDRAKIQIGRISPFGLMEMSRQRLRPSVSEVHTTACPHCQGRGIVRSAESISIQIIRALERDASLGTFVELRIVTPANVATHLFNLKRDKISAIEQKYGIRISVLMDESLHETGFRIEKLKTEGGDFVQEDRQSKRKRGGRNRDERRESRESREQRDNRQEAANSEPQEIAEGDEPVREDTVEASGENAEREPRGRRRRRRGGRGRDRERGDRPRTEGQDFSSAEAEAGVSEASENADSAGEDNAQEDGNGAPRERRGRRRNRRRWKDGRERGNEQSGASEEGRVAEPWQNGERGNSDDHIPTSYRHDREPSQPAVPYQSQQASYSAPAQPSFEHAGASSDASDSAPKKGWWRRIVE